MSTITVPLNEWQEVNSRARQLASLLAQLNLPPDGDAVEGVRGLVAEVRAWLCENCHTVYPGPPNESLSCVICQKCGGFTGPVVSIHNRRLRQERDRLRELLRRADRLLATKHAYYMTGPLHAEIDAALTAPEPPASTKEGMVR